MSEQPKAWEEVKAMEAELDRLRLKMAEIRATVLVNLDRGCEADGMQVLRFLRKIFFSEEVSDD